MGTVARCEREQGTHAQRHLAMNGAGNTRQEWANAALHRAVLEAGYTAAVEVP